MTTLPEMQKRTPFEGWEKFFDEDQAEDMRALYQETLQQLIDLGSQPARDACLEIITGFMNALEVLDEKYDGEISGTVSEEVCDIATKMAAACGITDVDWNQCDR